MKEGAFALLDCLGFKGIWQRGQFKENPELLVQIMEGAIRSAETLAAKRLVDEMAAGKIDIKTAFISDSVAISVSPVENGQLSPTERGYLVILCLWACAEITKTFLQTRTPILLRGCVAYGRHIFSRNLFLGPAVDEAASYSEVGQGAFIWAAPSAKEPYLAYCTFGRQAMADSFAGLTPAGRIEYLAKTSRFVGALQGNEAKEKMMAQLHGLSSDQMVRVAPLIHRAMMETWDASISLNGYPMPLRAGGVLRAVVLNPVCLLPANVREYVIANALTTFDSGQLDVLVKRQNTQQLFEASHKVISDREAAVKPILAELEADVKRIIAGDG